MNREVMFSHKTDAWETPDYLFREINAEFDFCLDVCATADNAKCERFFSKMDDGLKQKWEGVCWCNPPYGREISKWVRKAREEVENGDAEAVVMLLPARVDTNWFHNDILGRAEIRFLRGRVKFGKAKYGAPFPSMVVIFKRTCDER